MKIELPKSPLDFTKAFIRANRGERSGVHSVFSGYNETLKMHYNLSPIPYTKELVAQGVLVASKYAPDSPILVKKGAYLVLKEDAIAVGNKKASSLSKKTLSNLEKAFGIVE